MSGVIYAGPGHVQRQIEISVLHDDQVKANNEEFAANSTDRTS